MCVKFVGAARSKFEGACLSCPRRWNGLSNVMHRTRRARPSDSADPTSGSLRGLTMNFTAETQRSQRLFLKSKLLLFLRTPHLCDCPPTRNGCSKDNHRTTMNERTSRTPCYQPTGLFNVAVNLFPLMGQQCLQPGRRISTHPQPFCRRSRNRRFWRGVRWRLPRRP